MIAPPGNVITRSNDRQIGLWYNGQHAYIIVRLFQFRESRPDWSWFIGQPESAEAFNLYGKSIKF